MHSFCLSHAPSCTLVTFRPEISSLFATVGSLAAACTVRRITPCVRVPIPPLLEQPPSGSFPPPLRRLRRLPHIQPAELHHHLQVSATALLRLVQKLVRNLRQPLGNPPSRIAPAALGPRRHWLSGL